MTSPPIDYEPILTTILHERVCKNVGVGVTVQGPWSNPNSRVLLERVPG